MRFLPLLALLFVSFSVAAQQQQPPPPKPDAKQGSLPPTRADQESNSQFRSRTEGAAGGTIAPVPEREREGAGAGAKPHMHFDQLDRGLHRRSGEEVVAPPR